MRRVNSIRDVMRFVHVFVSYFFLNCFVCINLFIGADSAGVVGDNVWSVIRGLIGGLSIKSSSE